MSEEFRIEKRHKLPTYTDISNNKELQKWEQCYQRDLKKLEEKLQLDTAMMDEVANQLEKFTFNMEELKVGNFDSVRELIELAYIATNEYNFTCCCNFKNNKNNFIVAYHHYIYNNNKQFYSRDYMNYLYKNHIEKSGYRDFIEEKSYDINITSLTDTGDKSRKNLKDALNQFKKKINYH